MGFFRKATAAVVVVGGGWYFFLGSKPKVAPLTSAEFNALSDPAVRAKLVSHVKTLGPDRVVLYKLLGCPYCARVKAVLDAYRVPYSEVIIDPLFSTGLPDARYQLVPQIELRGSSSSTTKSDGVKSESAIIVDSSDIIRQLAKPLGYESQLTDPRVQQARDWITNVYAPAQFVALAYTYKNAFQTYESVVPESYNNAPCRILGAAVLRYIARRKVLPALEKQGVSLPTTAPSSDEGEEGGEKKKSSSNLETLPERRLLASQLIAFSEMRNDAVVDDNKSNNKKKRAGGGARPMFHGGNVADLADIELYGVMRLLMEHRSLEPLATGLVLGTWVKKMADTCTVGVDKMPKM